MDAEILPPVPPAWLPPGRVALLEGRGEIFYRDSGRESARRGTVLLLHGWTWSADLNWAFCYRGLVDAGFRVIAVDHRGHGRGMRTGARFRLEEVAEDAAALLRKLDTGPAVVAGYSMGGTLTQLLARRHPELVRGMVLAATWSWLNGIRRLAWMLMGVFQWILRILPRRFWARLLRDFGPAEPPRDAWILGELSRGEARDIAEAGRELGRFDSRPWAATLRFPAAVVVPRRDRLVPPRRQRALAKAIPGATLHEVAGDHGDVILGPGPVPDEIVRAVVEVAEASEPSAQPAQAAAQALD